MEKKQKINLIIVSILTVISIAELVYVRNSFKLWLNAVLWIALVLLWVMFVISLVKKLDYLYKFVLVCFYCAIFVLTAYCILLKTGVFDKFDSAEDLLEYVSDDPIGILTFIAITFLQVTFIPLPSTVTTVGGVWVFGPGRGFIFSLIGQVAGSMLAFYLGRKFGVKLVKWFVGEEVFEKYQKFIKGRDKIILIFMFLFPFFPDDVLCLFAGLTNMTGFFFFIIMLISRSITIGYTTLFMGVVSSIPFSGWGIPVYILIGIVIIALLYFFWKKGEQIENAVIKTIYKTMPAFLQKGLIPKDELNELANKENKEKENSSPAEDEQDFAEVTKEKRDEGSSESGPYNESPDGCTGSENSTENENESEKQ